MKTGYRGWAVAAAMAAAALILRTVPGAWATSRIYAPLERFIDGADLIALVEVGPPESSAGDPNPDPKSAYRQRTQARVRQCLKGKADSPIVVLHGKGFDDILFQQGAGLYLVFLKQTRQGAIPYDGWPSSKAVLNGRVLGWKHHPYHDSGNPGTPLLQVIPEITSHFR